MFNGLGGRFDHWHIVCAGWQNCRIVSGQFGIDPMSSITIGLQSRDGEVLPSRQIQARWKGNNLAVHAAMVHRADIEDVGPATKDSHVNFRWRVTHLGTGFAAAKFMHLTDALKVAKLFDSLFVHTTKSAVKADTELVEMFGAEVRKNGGILASAG